MSAPEAPEPRPARSRRRKVVFALVTLLFATGVALVAAELVLRWDRRRIETSEVMDPGLVEYDRVLGWRLAPGWRGRHRHHDFDVAYTVGAHGFRGPAPRERGAGHPAERVALVGDSFTFGIGVGDEHTFARRLEAAVPDGAREVLNFGVPGYGTDQELLLLEREVLPLEPDVVVLVVCLINDLFDNPRPFPLQAHHAKPRFRLEADGTLELERVPVPKERKGAAEGREDLERLIHGLDLDRPGGASAFLGRREIFRRLGLFQAAPAVPPGHFEGRYDAMLALFDALVARMREGVEARGGRLVLALVPGRSYVERPDSYAHRYQDHLREQIARTWRGRGLEVVDVAADLAAAHAAGEGPFFHPHEGHLDAEGNARVARALDAALRREADGG